MPSNDTFNKSTIFATRNYVRQENDRGYHVFAGRIMEWLVFAGRIMGLLVSIGTLDRWPTISFDVH